MIKKPIEKKKEEDKSNPNEKKESSKQDGPEMKIDPSQFKMDPNMFKDGKIDDGAFKNMYDSYMNENNMNEADMNKAFEELGNNMDIDPKVEPQSNSNTSDSESSDKLHENVSFHSLKNN